ncbi:stomatin-like protein 1 isoform X5 [Carcharodon carcharias]|uniref:stomatin-like protein 1 isoform X5 n=1 Tax=Carcharodon carcharias TaxID=13397 RepID=UPI001B7F2BBE|nr:stomatin-like protein 1 isoform X5 [Carcharodon carcharias]
MRMSYQPVPSTEENLRAGHQRKERSWGPVRKDLRTGKDSTQGCPELICSWILIVLTSLLMILTFPITGWFVLKSVPKYERFVVFRLGRIIGSKGPGMILLLPFIDHWQKVDLRSKTFTIAPFEATCKDGAVIIIGAEVHYHIWNPVLSVAVVEDIDSTTVFTAQNMMIHFLLKRTLAKIQADKNKSGEQLAFLIDSVQASPEESGSEEFESDIVNPDWILSKVKAFLTEDLVKQIGACYLFTVNQKDGTQNLYYLDLSRDSGMAGYGMPEGDPDVALEVTEDTMQALFLGDLKPFSAYMSGRIRIQGDLKLAMKLEDLIKKLNR